MPEITITPAVDNRPPTPPIQTLWICRWQIYEFDRYMNGWEWRTRTSMFAHDKIEEANRESNEIIAKGGHRVEIVAIYGDEL